jgi:hypothetical protein
MSVLIQKSKTDIYRDRNRIIIAGTGNNLCLINNFDLYLQWVGNNLEFDFYLFQTNKQAHSLRWLNTLLLLYR